MQSIQYNSLLITKFSPAFGFLRPTAIQYVGKTVRGEVVLRLLSPTPTTAMSDDWSVLFNIREDHRLSLTIIDQVNTLRSGVV